MYLRYCNRATKTLKVYFVHDFVILSTRNSPFSCIQLPYPITKSTWNFNAIMNRHENPRNLGSNSGPTQKFVSQPTKRLRPYSDSDVSQNLSQNLQ